MASVRQRLSNGNWVASFFLLIGMLAITLFCFSEGVAGNDYWWHVKIGEYVCKNHVVPTTDIFSWLRFEREIPWTAHEWLADVIFYLLDTVAGETGIFLFSLTAAICMIFCLWLQGKDAAVNNVLISGLYYCVFAILTSMFFYGRPQIFSFFLVFFELKILCDFYERDGGKSIWFVPLLAMLWSNLHGGSANLSYLLCGLFLLVGSFDFHFGRIEGKILSSKSRKTLLLVLLCTIGAILINPVGLHVFTYPYVNLSDKVSMTVISEWKAPDAKNLGQLILFFFPIVLTSFGLVAGEKKSRLIDWLIMLAFVFLFFRSMRFIVFWFIAAPFYAFRYFPKCQVKEMKGKLEKGLSLLLLAILIIFIGYEIVEITGNLREKSVVTKVIEDQAVEAIKADAPKRLFNDYNVSESLIYHDVPVFFDARADLFSKPGILGDGVGLMMLRSIETAEDDEAAPFDPEQIIEKYDFDALVILKSRPLYVYLNSHPEKYGIVYEDAVVSYFRRLK